MGGHGILILSLWRHIDVIWWRHQWHHQVMSSCDVIIRSRHSWVNNRYFVLEYRGLILWRHHVKHNVITLSYSMTSLCIN
jgi:hypothetical protein